MNTSPPWQIAAPPDAETQRLAAALDIPVAAARALQNRGVRDAEEAERFLRPQADHAHDPFRMSGMEAAVARLLAAARRNERVLVYGDYDVDGLTATALLSAYLKRNAYHVELFVPHRLEQGYGLHLDEVERAAAQGVRLIVTVDTGIRAAAEVERARAVGVDVIVTDHHEPPPDLPAAVAVLNPKRAGCGYPEKELSGAGVAFKLCQALAARGGGDDPWDLVDLAALGAIADVVPLRGENRVLVALGLRRLNERPRPGIAELLRVLSERRGAGRAGVDAAAEPLTAERVAFLLAPRLNAVGRMGRVSPAVGVELLLADGERAAELARIVDEENEFRIRVERAVLAEAEAAAERERHLPAIALAGEDWHPGVLGIVAARLQERFRRPTLIVSWDRGGEEGRGSARAGAGFDLPGALSACSDALLRFGGHAAAAGLSIARRNWEAFRARFLRQAEAAAAQVAAAAEPLAIDAEIAAREFTAELARAVEAMQPFGPANPAPRFLLRGLVPVRARAVGRDGLHLMLHLQGSGGEAIEGVGFGLAARWDGVLAGAAAVDAVVTPTLESWRGRWRLRARFADLAAAEASAPAVRAALTARPPGRARAGPLVDRRGDHGRAAAAIASFRDWPGACGIVAWTGSLDRWRRALAELPAPLSTWVGAGLVAAGGGPSAPLAAPHVLLEPPPSRAALLRLVERAAAGGQPLVLGFGRGDLPVARRALAAVAPDREALASVYRGLRSAAGSGRLVRAVELAAACPRVPEETVRVAWWVFCELGVLVERGDSVAEFRPPAGRLDLAHSRVHASLAAMRQEFEAFGEWIMGAPVDEIWKQVENLAAGAAS